MFIAPLLLQALPALTSAPLAPQQEAQVRDLLLVFTEGGESLFSDPKDQAMLAALRLLDDRVLELPGELPDFPEELATLMPFISRLASGPMTLRVGAWEGMDAPMGLPVFAQLTLNEESPEAARGMASRMTEMLTSMGMPQPQVDEAGRVIVPAPIPVWYGASGSDVKITIGQSDEGELVPGETGLPEGVSPKLAVSLEYGEIMEMVMSFAAMAGETEGMEFIEMLDSMGLLDMSMQMAYGTDDTHGYTVLALPGYGATMEEQGLLPERNLTAADLARIPADATWAQVNTTNITGQMDFFMGMMEDQLAAQGMSGDPMEMVRAQLGFDPMADLFDHMGSVTGYYTSDTTGGNSIMSLILFMEMRDGEAFEDTMAGIKGMANAIAGAQAMGYVRFKEWEADGASYTTLTFPGMPIPVELTYSIDNGYMYAGMTPQAVMGAVAQGRSDNGGLLANQRFRENMSGGMEGLGGVAFVDTPRILADGYGVALMAGSALRNLTRSPQDESRDAGLVIPPYPVLANGARPVVATTRFIDGDVVSEARGDRSMVVSWVAGIGMLFNSPVTPLILGGAAVGGFAVYEEQERQMRLKTWQIEQMENEDPWDEDEDF